MSFNFDHLANHIVSIQNTLSANAAHAVNLSLTARNWLIGWYIVEYEQNGEDRAQYGEALLKNLAQRIHMRGLGERRLYEFRQLYNVYPQLSEQILPFVLKISKKEILRMPSAISAPITLESWQTPTNKLFNNLSATHLLYLSNIQEPLKRACMYSILLPMAVLWSDNLLCNKNKVPYWLAAAALPTNTFIKSI